MRSALSIAFALALAQPLVIGETFTMRSEVLQEERRINVYLPPAYLASPDARLPVLSMPDGGVAEDFVHVARSRGWRSSRSNRPIDSAAPPARHSPQRAKGRLRIYEVRQRSSRGEGRRLEVAEARAMLAREAGLGNWIALLDAVRAGRPAPGTPYQIDRKKNAIAPRRAFASGDWDALLDVMREQVHVLPRHHGRRDGAAPRPVEAEDVLRGKTRITDRSLEGLPHVTADVATELGAQVRVHHSP